MIFETAAYYDQVYQNLDRRKRRMLVAQDRVTMAMVLASTATWKRDVNYGAMAELARMLERRDRLAVYLDMQGFPVSYVMFGCLEGGASNDAVGIGAVRPSEHACIIDFVGREGALDETIDCWLKEHDVSAVAFRRHGRPKLMRSYDVKRLSSLRWRLSKTEGRFILPKGAALEEHEAFARSAVSDYRRVETLLDELIVRLPSVPFPASSFELLAGLQSAGQLRTTFRGGRCVEAVIIALTDVDRWGLMDTASILSLSLPSFLDGNDLLVIDLLREEQSATELIVSVLDEFHHEGEDRVYIHHPDQPPHYASTEPVSALWRLVCGSGAGDALEELRRR